VIGWKTIRGTRLSEDDAIFLVSSVPDAREKCPQIIEQYLAWCFASCKHCATWLACIKIFREF
jgi:hypothetical protein